MSIEKRDEISRYAMQLIQRRYELDRKLTKYERKAGDTLVLDGTQE